jgi:hypothetical protein
MSDPIYTQHLKPADNPLDYSVYIPVKDGVAESIWSGGFMGLGEWDTDLGRWVSVTKGSTKPSMWRAMTTYSIDWDNKDAFNSEDKFLGYELLSKGELTEDWLKENAKLAWDFSGNTSEIEEE